MREELVEAHGVAKVKRGGQVDGIQCSTANPSLLTKASDFFYLSGQKAMPIPSQVPAGFQPDGYGQNITQMEFNAYYAVPEPASLLLLGTDLIGTVRAVRRKRG